MFIGVLNTKGEMYMVQKRIKSITMWLGIAAPIIVSYIATNSTAAIGGNEKVDMAIIWIGGLISILAAINNPNIKNRL